jgi:hypothetical protein
MVAARRSPAPAACRTQVWFNPILLNFDGLRAERRAHLAPVPTTSPNWIGAAVMLAVAAGCTPRAPRVTSDLLG